MSYKLTRFSPGNAVLDLVGAVGLSSCANAGELVTRYRDDSDNCGGREREIKLQAFYGRKCASGGDSTTIFGDWI